MPMCRRCGSTRVSAQPASGRGRVASFTVNRQQWGPEDGGPYLIALVELEEQAGLNLLTNLVDCGLDEVAMGMPVEVAFRPLEDVWLPLFRPARER